MHDFLQDLLARESLDPMESARRNMRPNWRARFYKEVKVGDVAPFSIMLDGKSVKTPAGHVLAAPTPELAKALAAEWDAQGERVDPATMPLTRLANAVIDGVTANPKPAADEIAKYLGSDLLCYRADAPNGLVAKQAEHWDPVVAWARDELGARFILSEGVVFVAQPNGAVAVARTAIPTDPWRLGAANVITTLTGSALLALAMSHGKLSAEAAWDAANVDEDWNIAQWGRDELAMDRRAARYADMQAAGTVLALTGA